MGIIFFCLTEDFSGAHELDDKVADELEAMNAMEVY